MAADLRLMNDPRIWGTIVLVSVSLACWFFRSAARKVTWRAAMGGALMGCAVWSLHHLTMMSETGNFSYRHPLFTLAASLLAAMIGCGLAVGNMTANVDRHARRRAFSGIDWLTGLRTRSQLESSIRTEIEQSQADGSRFALLLVDLDKFKGVNDALGHEAGDLVLQQVAERLNQTTRVQGSIARVGSDEFMMLLPNIEAQNDIQIACRRILTAVAEPLTVGDRHINVTSSIGVAVYPEDGSDVSTLLRKVDTALDRAKTAGRGDFRIFDPAVDKALLERLDLENDLRQALGRNEFRLMYQPEFDLRTGKVVSMEALLRWNKNGTFISPAKFIPVAEDTGVIVPLSQWVLETACRELKDLRSTLDVGSRFAVNLSPRQFKQDNLVEMISSTLKAHDVDPTNLELEITEGVLMDDPEKSALCLRTLRDLGITTAIDDFGTGYSSLSYLRRFPIDKLKMDRTFVSDIHNDKDGAALTESILRMAHQLGLTVVAEGVELPQQLEFLRSVRCDAVQGFLLAKPMFLADLKNFLSNTETPDWAAQ